MKDKIYLLLKKIQWYLPNLPIHNSYSTLNFPLGLKLWFLSYICGRKESFHKLTIINIILSKYPQNCFFWILNKNSVFLKFRNIGISLVSFTALKELFQRNFQSIMAINWLELMIDQKWWIVPNSSDTVNVSLLGRAATCQLW